MDFMGKSDFKLIICGGIFTASAEFTVCLHDASSLVKVQASLLITQHLESQNRCFSCSYVIR